MYNTGGASVLIHRGRSSLTLREVRSRFTVFCLLDTAFISEYHTSSMAVFLQDLPHLQHTATNTLPSAHCSMSVCSSLSIPGFYKYRLTDPSQLTTVLCIAPHFSQLSPHQVVGSHQHRSMRGDFLASFPLCEPLLLLFS